MEEVRQMFNIITAAIYTRGRRTAKGGKMAVWGGGRDNDWININDEPYSSIYNRLITARARGGFNDLIKSMSKISLSPLHLATEMLLSVSCLFEATSIID